MHSKKILTLFILFSSSLCLIAQSVTSLNLKIPTDLYFAKDPASGKSIRFNVQTKLDAISGSAVIGEATLPFGTDPGSEYASVVVTGQANVAVDSAVTAWFMADTTGTNTANTHEAAAAFVRVVATDIVPGVGFTLKAFVLVGKFSGDLNVRWSFN